MEVTVKGSKEELEEFFGESMGFSFNDENIPMLSMNCEQFVVLSRDIQMVTGKKTIISLEMVTKKIYKERFRRVFTP